MLTNLQEFQLSSHFDKRGSNRGTKLEILGEGVSQEGNAHEPI